MSKTIDVLARFLTNRCIVFVCALGILVVPTALEASEWLGSDDCQLRLLGPGDIDELPSNYKGAVIQPQARHRLVVTEALAQMPPLTCAAVQRAVFVHDIPHHEGEEGWVDPDDPDLVNINVDTLDPLRRGEQYGAYFLVKAMQAFLHESTHSADYLLLAHSVKAGRLNRFVGVDLYQDSKLTTTPDSDDWPVRAQRLAREVVKNNRLGGSLRAEWQRIQEAFISFGLAGPYLGKRGANEGGDDAGQLAKSGFASRYGASKIGEDIAESAAWMLAAPLVGRRWDGKLMPPESVDNYACRAMQANQGAAVPAQLAVLFTKANLLLSAGLVTQEAYDLCVGKLRLREPGQGVFVYEFIGDPVDDNIQLRRNFNQNVSISIGTHAKLAQYVFQLSADGNTSFGDKEYQAEVKLRVVLAPGDRDLELVSWPRGIYDLHAFGNNFEVDIPQAPAGTFFATKGFLLVGYASNKRIDGSIFLQQAIRPFAPMAVPQTGLPLRFTFSVSK